MMPGIIRLIFIVSFKPIVKRRDANPGTIWNSTTSNFFNSFTYGDFRVDRLHGYHNIVFFKRIEVLVEESINEDDISRVNGGFHGCSIGVAESDYVSFCEEVGGDDWDDAEVVHYIFEHC